MYKIFQEFFFFFLFWILSLIYSQTFSQRLFYERIIFSLWIFFHFCCFLLFSVISVITKLCLKICIKSEDSNVCVYNMFILKLILQYVYRMLIITIFLNLNLFQKYLPLFCKLEINSNPSCFNCLKNLQKKTVLFSFWVSLYKCYTLNIIFIYFFFVYFFVNIECI